MLGLLSKDMKEEHIYTSRRFSGKEMVEFKNLKLTLREYVDINEEKFDISHPLLYQHVLSTSSYVVGIDVVKTMSKNREGDAVFARFMTMYFMKKLSDQYEKKVGKLTSTQIGEKAGGKDHATALWGIKTVENVIFTNSKTDRRTAWFYTVHDKLQVQLSVSIDISLDEQPLEGYRAIN